MGGEENARKRNAKVYIRRGGSSCSTSFRARQGAGAVVQLIIAAIPITFFIICQSNVIETMTTSGMKD